MSTSEADRRSSARRAASPTSVDDGAGLLGRAGLIQPQVERTHDVRAVRPDRVGQEHRQRDATSAATDRRTAPISPGWTDQCCARRCPARRTGHPASTESVRSTCPSRRSRTAPSPVVAVISSPTLGPPHFPGPSVPGATLTGSVTDDRGATNGECDDRRTDDSVRDTRRTSIRTVGLGQPLRPPTQPNAREPSLRTSVGHASSANVSAPIGSRGKRASGLRPNFVRAVDGRPIVSFEHDHGTVSSHEQRIRPTGST